MFIYTAKKPGTTVELTRIFTTKELAEYFAIDNFKKYPEFKITETTSEAVNTFVKAEENRLEV